MERLIYIVVLCYFVSSVLITQSPAAIGADCKSNAAACDATKEECESDVCVCKTGFINNAGSCETFDCNSDGTCKNGGTCVGGTAKCTCVGAWKGDDCGRATLDVGCSGASECTADNNEVCGTGGKCACKPGFEEESGICKDINECQPNPCLNGATCANNENAFVCTCVAGWSGTTCDTFNCNGVTDACKNSGTCNTGVAACSCAAGYMGDDCRTDVDDCEPAPCLNGATCVDAVNSYSCTCATGWTGTKCERAIVDDCAGTPPKCPDTVVNGECSGTACVCKEGYQKKEDSFPNAADKTVMTAGTLMMIVLINITIQLF